MHAEAHKLGAVDHIVHIIFVVLLAGAQHVLLFLIQLDLFVVAVRLKVQLAQQKQNHQSGYPQRNGKRIENVS